MALGPRGQGGERRDGGGAGGGGEAHRPTDGPTHPASADDPRTPRPTPRPRRGEFDRLEFPFLFPLICFIRNFSIYLPYKARRGIENSLSI